MLKRHSVAQNGVATRHQAQQRVGCRTVNVNGYPVGIGRSVASTRLTGIGVGILDFLYFLACMCLLYLAWMCVLGFSQREKVVEKQPIAPVATPITADAPLPRKIDSAPQSAKPAQLPVTETPKSRVNPTASKNAPGVTKNNTASKKIALSMYAPKPEYPVQARNQGMQGKVVVHAYITAAGMVEMVEVASSSGHSILDDAALAEVKKWLFLPATEGNMAVPSEVMVPIVFVLNEE